MPYRRFGFDDAGFGFDQFPFDSTLAYHEIQAGKTLPAFFASATVQSRTPARAEVTATTTFAAPSATAAVQSRTPARAEVTATTTFAASSAATSLVRTKRLEAECADIPMGVPDSHDATSILFQSVFPFVPTSFVVGGGSTRLIQLAFNSANGLSNFETIGPDLISEWEQSPAAIHLIAGNGAVALGGPDALDNTADDDSAPYAWSMGTQDRADLAAWLATYAGDAVTLRICGATTNYLKVAASRTLPATVSTVALSKTSVVVRQALQCSVAYVAAGYTAALQTRTPARHVITASRSSPAVSATTTLNHHEQLTGDKTLPVLAGTVALQTRAPARRVVAVSRTFPAPIATVAVLSESPLTASAGYGNITTAATVLTRAPARLSIAADRAFGAFTSALDLLKLEPRLTLADFNAGNLRVDALALITRRGTGSVLWNRAGSRFGGSDTLDDGEINIGNPDTPITRIRHTSATRLQLNDDGGITLSTYFGASGDGFESTIWFQTIDGVASFTTDGNIATPGPGGGYIWFAIPADVNALLADVAVTDHFIFAITRPALVFAVTAAGRFNPVVGTVSVQQRNAARHVITPSSAFGAFAGTVAVAKRRTDEILTAATRYQAAAPYTAVVNKRVFIEELTAARTFPDPTFNLFVQRRQGIFIPIGAVAAFDPHVVETAALLQREAARRAVTAGEIYAAATLSVSLLSRLAQRRELTAARTFPAFAGDAATLKQKPLIAVATFPALLGAVDLLSLLADRHVITAARAFPPLANATATLDTRRPIRKALTAATAYGAPAYAAALEKRIPLTAAATRAAIAAAAAVLSATPKREPLELAPYQTVAAAYAAAVLQRIALRHVLRPSRDVTPPSYTTSINTKIPLQAAVGYAAYTTALTLSQTAPLRTPLRFVGYRAFGFDSAGVGFDQAPFSPVPVGSVPFTGTVAVLQRIAVRHTMRAGGFYGATTFTAALGKRIPLTAVRAFVAASPTASVQTRVAARVELQADSTYGAVAASADLLQRTAGRIPLTAARIALALSSTVRVDTLEPARNAVTAATTYAAHTTALDLLQRIANRIPITADSTFPAISGAAEMSKRIPLPASVAYGAASSTVALQKLTIMQKAVAGATTYGIATYTAALQQRTSLRRPLLVDATLPAYVSALGLRKRIPLTASATHAALLAAAAILIRIPDRFQVEPERQFPEFVGILFMSKTTSMQKAVLADRSFFATTHTASVLKRAPVRHVVTAAALLPFQRGQAAVLTRTPIPGILNLDANATYNAIVAATTLELRRAVGKALTAGETFPPAVYSAHLDKGAAMPPDIVMGLMLVLAGYDNLRIMWVQPGLGTGILLNYEFELDGSGVWTSTTSAAAEYTIAGLQPDTAYAISVRAVSNVGRGPGSATLMTRTLPITIPSVPLDLRAMPPGGERIDLSWHLPITDGGSPITNYEIRVAGPDGVEYPVESTGNAGLAYRASGLALYQRYGFQVRAVNSMGRSDYTGIVYATPVILPAVLPRVGQRIPLLDLDRQSLILRLASRDTRLRVWYQPSDSAWYASLESPANSPAITSRKITTGTGLLDNLPDVLPGNFVCRAIDDDSTASEPARDAWRRQTHGLFYVEA